MQLVKEAVRTLGECGDNHFAHGSLQNWRPSSANFGGIGNPALPMLVPIDRQTQSFLLGLRCSAYRRGKAKASVTANRTEHVTNASRAPQPAELDLMQPPGLGDEGLRQLFLQPQSENPYTKAPGNEQDRPI